MGTFFLFCFLNNKLGVLGCLTFVLVFLILLRLNGLCLFLSDFSGIVVHREGYFFCLGVVEDSLHFWRLVGVFAVATTHIDGHGNLLQVVHGVENLAENDDCFHAQIDEESYCRKTEDCRQSGYAQQSLNLLAEGQSVIAARIEAGIFEKWCQELSKCY